MQKLCIFVQSRFISALIFLTIALSVNYSYLADGTKLTASDKDGNGYVYWGSLVYKQECAVVSHSLWLDPVGPPQPIFNPFSSVFESASFDGGRFAVTETADGVEYTPHYHLTDPVGSVRVIVDGNTGEVLERNDHYPFGLRVDKASYSPTLDRIICPEKQQFSEGAAFYTTLLHEIAHSTGHPQRLNRLQEGRNSTEYAREELVTELTAALSGAMLGLATTPRKENPAYLKWWLEVLRKQPNFPFEILANVNKAARMIDKQLEPTPISSSQEACAEAA